ncbi:LysM peptidoglycan-binding domain-containing protein [Demequina aurantiaca]|uniref:LysM peptidoglycan-binding domain-containing protein n=1 Tax=Demequina aurantiaca TaxID=676200 RepID=UPI003D328673
MKIYAPNNPAARAKRAGFVVVLLAMAVVVGPQAFANSSADDASAVVNADTYTVMPGDTLWVIANSITPSGDDVRETVGAIQRLNVMESSALRAGEELLLPAQV